MIKRLTIFFTSIDEIKEALLDRCNSGNNSIINVATLSLDNFRNPQYNPQESKAVFWKPQNCSFIVMTSNLLDGWDSLVTIISKHLSVPYLEIALDEDYRVFHYNNRYVRVMWDGKWDFYEYGTPFPFELLDQYANRLIKKRLTIDMIINYAKQLNVDITDPNMYCSNEDAIYFSNHWH